MLGTSFLAGLESGEKCKKSDIEKYNKWHEKV